MELNHIYLNKQGTFRVSLTEERCQVSHNQPLCFWFTGF